jgi:hypothetical protein
VRLDAEMNTRLHKSTKSALFRIAETTGTTAAALVRGYVEELTSNPRWAEALKAPSDRVPSRGRVIRPQQGTGRANPLIQGRVSRKLGGKP